MGVQLVLFILLYPTYLRIVLPQSKVGRVSSGLLSLVRLLGRDLCWGWSGLARGGISDVYRWLAHLVMPVHISLHPTSAVHTALCWVHLKLVCNKYIRSDVNMPPLHMSSQTTSISHNHMTIRARYFRSV
jgi:hypothetical protein